MPFSVSSVRPGATAAAIKQQSAPFDPLAFLAKDGAGRCNLKFSANATVFAQGDPADSVFYLQKGKVKISVTASSGKEAVTAIRGPGEFFGESCLLGHRQRLANITAVTDISVMRIEISILKAVVHDHVEFAELFIAYLLRRNRRAEDDLVDQLFNSSEKRLARTLLLLANVGNDEKSEPVLSKISQETLAEMVGTTRSRISHFMTKFRKLGLIEYNGKLTVNSSLLRVVLNDSGSDVAED